MENHTYQIGLVHATMNSVPPILKEFRKYVSKITVLNFMDEGIINELNETGVITSKMVRKLIDLAEKAEDSGVDAILFTCSSFSPYIPLISEFFEIPMLSADYAMLEQAVNIGGCIGVIATVEKAGPTTTKLLYDIANERGQAIQVETKVIPDAFQALQKGDRVAHDDLIHQEIDELIPSCDVILLAQYSMAQSLETLNNKTKPILTSPGTGARFIISLLMKRDE